MPNSRLLFCNARDIKQHYWQQEYQHTSQQQYYYSVLGTSTWYSVPGSRLCHVLCRVTRRWKNNQYMVVVQVFLRYLVWQQSTTYGTWYLVPQSSTGTVVLVYWYQQYQVQVQVLVATGNSRFKQQYLRMGVVAGLPTWYYGATVVPMKATRLFCLLPSAASRHLQLLHR